MANQDSNLTAATFISMIVERLKRAHDIAAAAGAMAANGNHDGAFRILLDIEESTHEATTLLNAASVIRRSDLV